MANTLYELIADLEKVVPEISAKRQEIAAHIKKHVHDEKHHVHFMYDLHFLREPSYYLRPRTRWDRFLAKLGLMRKAGFSSFFRQLKDFARVKMQTHDGDNWGNLHKCRQWCQEYIKP